MIAFNCSRRKCPQPPAPAKSPVDALAISSALPLDSVIHAAASHRAARRVDIHKDAQGRIAEIRIGNWRVVVSTENRRLAEVRELGCDRVAVRIDRLADNGETPSSQIWQLYRLDGQLEAALQTTPDGRFALLTNYRTRQACRLMADSQGSLRPVETWKI